MFPAAARLSATVIDIARYWGVFGWIAPVGPSRSAGITMNGALLAPASLVGRIGSPTVVGTIVIFPITSSGRGMARGGAASVFILTRFTSPGGIGVFAGIAG